MQYTNKPTQAEAVARALSKDICYAHLDAADDTGATLRALDRVKLSPRLEEDGTISIRLNGRALAVMSVETYERRFRDHAAFINDAGEVVALFDGFGLPPGAKGVEVEGMRVTVGAISDGFFYTEDDRITTGIWIRLPSASAFYSFDLGMIAEINARVNSDV
ncbi:MAG TPA: hypothetical protein VGI19_18625 [Candidatus Cybelea sp.]|jgi:hypothetical protein